MKHMMMAAALSCAMTGCSAEISSAPPAPGHIDLGALPKTTKGYLAGADANHDGVLDADELAHHYAAHTREVFQRLDQNGDGRLEWSELPPGLRRSLASADRDGDGAISLDEFIAQHNARLVRRLRHADRNGDGALDPHEVGSLHWARLQAADADHDGKVTFAELRRAFGHRGAASSR